MSWQQLDPQARTYAQQHLTKRQLDVLQRTLEGQSRRVIARDIGITVSTVQQHLDRALQIMGRHYDRKDAA